MPATSLLQVFAYTSRAGIPVPQVSVTVTDPQGRLLAIRQTNSSGLIEPIPISVPEKSESLDHTFQGQPFTLRVDFCKAPGLPPDRRAERPGLPRRRHGPEPGNDPLEPASGPIRRRGGI